ncbi:MAG: glycosyltransferase [Lachnospiraceae bacterium]|nr:glycosyltransferase [Lachnospiraceae bacterium]
MKTAVLIPCYNEETTIEAVIKDFRHELPDADIYVYDNNCTDDTAKIAEAAGAIVRKENRQGKGNVIRTMFRDIDADCYIMADGDDTYPASFAPAFRDMILNEHVDMVIGDRLSSTYFSENKRPFHNFGNKLVRNLINSLFGSDIRDIMTGARAFSRDFVKSFAIMSEGFEIETEMTVFALDNRMNVKEVPVEYRDRREGSESKLNTFSDGMKVIKTIFSLLRDIRPMRFFGWIGGFFVLIGLLFFIPIILEYINTGMVPRFPTLIVISAAWIIGIISFFCGLILTVIKNQSRREFERFLNLLHCRF